MLLTILDRYELNTRQRTKVWDWTARGGQTALPRRLDRRVQFYPKIHSRQCTQRNWTKLYEWLLGVVRRCSTKGDSKLLMELIDWAKTSFEYLWREELDLNPKNRLGTRLSRLRGIFSAEGTSFSLIQTSNRHGRRGESFGRGGARLWKGGEVFYWWGERIG